MNYFTNRKFGRKRGYLKTENASSDFTEFHTRGLSLVESFSDHHYCFICRCVRISSIDATQTFLIRVTSIVDITQLASFLNRLHKKL